MSPHGKMSFLSYLNDSSRIFDIGCGNNSPYKIKKRFPNMHYTGIDVGDHNQLMPNLADSYIISSAKNFHEAICAHQNHFDGVISSHNIEHCYYPSLVFEGMINSLKPGGMLYVAFPTRNSINFPSRLGTLNYFDDPTHNKSVPDPLTFIDIAKKNECEIIYFKLRYRPFLYFILGFLSEPFSFLRRKVLRGTWEFYGFETIIWLKRN